MKNCREFAINIGGINCTITADDNYLDEFKNSFDPQMVKLLKILAANSKTILDIGANIGCTAILFGELSENVYAFEPSPTTFEFLEMNIAKSGKTNVFPQNIGAGEKPGEYTLTFAPSNRSGAYISNQTQASAGHTIEKVIIRKLDDVVNSLDIQNIDFIKIDVEGFEGHVLRGAKKTLSSFRPLVVLELNHWCLNAFQRTSIPDFFDFLRSVFPILLSVDRSKYMDLHDENDSYIVMHHHILHGRFPNIVAGFDEIQFNQFRTLYQHGFTESKLMSWFRRKIRSFLY